MTDSKEVNLRGADLRNADLRRADLRRADLRAVNFTGARLWAADVREASCSDAVFEKADLRGANLNNTNLNYAILNGANLIGANLQETSLYKAAMKGADLRSANLNAANLSEADLVRVNFGRANLSGANLSSTRLWAARFVEANLNGANLVEADLNDANLTRASLKWANLSGANLNRARLIGCSIYAVSAWNVSLSETIQSNLVITNQRDSAITVDNLEVAQFIYLLLNNEKIRNVIDSITYKVVLILGRFTPERKAILNAIRDELRKHNYLPVLFDFEKPVNRDITETVSILAHLARFVIADITDAKSIPQELMMIVPNLPSVPIQPLLLSSQHEYGMYEYFIGYPWVQPIYYYHVLNVNHFHRRIASRETLL